MELKSPLHEMTKDGLELGKHLLVCVLAIRVIGGRKRSLLREIELATTEIMIIAKIKFSNIHYTRFIEHES